MLTWEGSWPNSLVRRPPWLQVCSVKNKQTNKECFSKEYDNPLYCALTLSGMTLENQEKCWSLEPPRGNFYKTQLAGLNVKITRLMSILTSKKIWKNLKKKSADKIWSHKDKGIKNVPPPCQIGLIHIQSVVKENRDWQMGIRRIFPPNHAT